MASGSSRMDGNSSGTFGYCCCSALEIVRALVTVVAVVVERLVVGSLLRWVADRMSCLTAKALTGRMRQMAKVRLVGPCCTLGYRRWR